MTDRAPLLASDVAGQGDGLLLVHAGVCDRRMWDGQFEQLAGGRRVLRVDLRGFGESPPADRPIPLGDDLAAAMDAAGIDRAVVVGCSFGGLAALELALDHPHRVSGLVLVCSTLDDHEFSDVVRRFGAEENRLFEAGDIDGAVELNVRMWANGPHADRVRAMQRRAFELALAGNGVDPPDPDPPLGERLGEVRCPALVITGELDGEDFQQIGARLAGGIAGARLEQVSGAGHLPSMERPDEFMRLLTAFLDEDRGE